MAEHNDLFARAQGPRSREHLPDEELICPWCGASCSWGCSRWREDVHREITACPDCGKEFMFPDVEGEFVCVGLLSPADMKYLATQEPPHAA